MDVNLSPSPDYSGGGLRGWLRALSRASVHISALLWNGCQLRLLGCDNGASIPLSHADFMPASLSPALSRSLVSLPATHPSSAAGMLGEKIAHGAQSFQGRIKEESVASTERKKRIVAV
ncbi:unnamed protein product [Pleuronectes platessa]|uniref:Uncharacterized protein n=1 Tax=Pleuronectes platessa TaxID=8262 RepID=A0A9N7YG44_PLEPL|nr:unnamed protein product [Pleuronectes platessa]